MPRKDREKAVATAAGCPAYTGGDLMLAHRKEGRRRERHFPDVPGLKTVSMTAKNRRGAEER